MNKNNSFNDSPWKSLSGSSGILPMAWESLPVGKRMSVHYPHLLQDTMLEIGPTYWIMDYEAGSFDFPYEWLMCLRNAVTGTEKAIISSNRLIPDEDREKLVREIAQFVSGAAKQTRTEIRIKLDSGELVWVIAAVFKQIRQSDGTITICGGIIPYANLISLLNEKYVNESTFRRQLFFILNSNLSESKDFSAALAPACTPIDVIYAVKEDVLMIKSIAFGKLVCDSAGTDLFFIKDYSLRYLYASPAMCHLLGEPLKQVIGHTDDELLGFQALGENDRSVEHLQNHGWISKPQRRFVKGKASLFDDLLVSVTFEADVSKGSGRQTVGMIYGFPRRRETIECHLELETSSQPPHMSQNMAQAVNLAR
ncbi:hypothetical protein ACFL2Q_02390 [Thermodesulfobacteriota bacterium]